MNPRKARKTPRRESPSVTMRDVAREAGVSVGTVSRVMNNESGVKPANRDRVMAASRKLGWHPNGIAASLRAAATRTIAFIVPDIRNPLFAAIERAAETSLRTQGYTLIVANTNDDDAQEADILKLMIRRRVDGFMLAPSNELLASKSGRIRDLHVPLVLLDRELPESYDAVVSDQFGGMDQAVEHLLSLGHQRIALVSGGLHSRPGRVRHEGFVAAHTLRGLAHDPALVRLESFDPEFAYQAVQDLVSVTPRPSALITGGNLMLAGALRALDVVRLDVPRDISVLAVGDTDLSRFANPSFTAIRWDLERFGHTAAEILLARLQGRSSETRPRRVIIPTEIVLRRSCRALNLGPLRLDAA